MGYKGRDVEVSDIDDQTFLVVACDSCGGIGEKDYDEIKVPAQLVGRLTMRVALMEMIAVAAIPKILTVTISNEPDPTGTKILSGINAELEAADFVNLPCSISTEKNIPTRQTGLGISIVGTCLKENLKIAQSNSGNYVYCLGIPKFGKELTSEDDPEIAQVKHLKTLNQKPNIHDILPIGSRGILEEVNQLAKQADCHFVQNDHPIDIKKSAGPSSCIIFTTSDIIPDLFMESLPVTKIGRLISNESKNIKIKKGVSYEPVINRRS